MVGGTGRDEVGWSYFWAVWLGDEEGWDHPKKEYSPKKWDGGVPRNWLDHGGQSGILSFSVTLSLVAMLSSAALPPPTAAAMRLVAGLAPAAARAGGRRCGTHARREGRRCGGPCALVGREAVGRARREGRRRGGPRSPGKGRTALVGRGGGATDRARRWEEGHAAGLAPAAASRARSPRRRSQPRCRVSSSPSPSVSSPSPLLLALDVVVRRSMGKKKIG